MRQYTERRLYFADKCSKCGKGFQSFKRSRIKHELCRKCRKNAPNPNQVSLFPGVDVNSDRIILEGGGLKTTIGKQDDGSYGLRQEKIVCNCGGQQYNGKKWVGDHFVGCPKYK